jgi:hypothetical protein
MPVWRAYIGVAEACGANADTASALANRYIIFFMIIFPYLSFNFLIALTEANKVPHHPQN